MQPNNIDPLFEHYIREVPGLSYESPDSGWLARRVTRSLEKALGRQRIERHYWALKSRQLASTEFFREAMAESRIRLDCDLSPLALVPHNQPVIFIANHPFGVVDGLILCNIALSLRDDFRVVVNSLLCQDRELAHHFLPIDFSGSKEAGLRNIRAKQLADHALAHHIPLVLFPSGMVSTARRLGFGRVDDAPWTTFVAKLVSKQQPVVVPVFFFGRNSRPFHLASHVAEPLRMAMLMREALRRFGETVRVQIGDPILPEDYREISGRKALTDYLYSRVQALGTR